ncbi:MAG: hypothetical protein COU71_02540 [Parcubacteria group bacterium CG10_big_fil_rev_8_21_14_0_10_38_31]|nr:MAG: hypothetical protein COU71_02540 [Parcubacteria group bacterium CG10_big_fil_rev_8_21_14_0_10_38_31]
MKNFTKISLVAVLFALMPILSAFAANNYVVNGLCVSSSPKYGSLFFDVSAGTVNINGNNYAVEATRGLLLEDNSVMEIYAYRNIVANKTVVGPLVNTSNPSFKNNSVLLGRIYTGSEALKKGSSVTKHESYTSGCSEYTNLSLGQSTGTLALNDKVNTSSKLNVRINPSATAEILGKADTGSAGVIISGPIVSGPYSWWKIQYRSGLVGWSAGDWLSKDASVSSYVAETPAPVTNTTNVSQVGVGDASFEQMASALEAAKALLEQLTNSLKALQK